MTILQNKKRLCALLLTSLMLLSQLPLTALAESAPPEDGQIPAIVKTITGWTFVNDENLNAGELALPGVNMDKQADFDTVVSLLPTQISGSVDGAEDLETLDITGWDCPEYKRDAEGNWPLSGEYAFTAILPDGYACAPLPTVKALLGGAEAYTINDRFTVGSLHYKELGPDTVQLIGDVRENPTGTLTIPSRVTKPSNGRTYTVVSIGNYAFNGCSGLTGELTLPDTLIQIGDVAFNGCSGFTDRLILPESLKEIGEAAFSGCSGLTGELTLPNTLTQIGNSAFSSSGFTGDLTLPESLTEIGDAAFYGCRGFSDRLILPESLTEIGNFAFYGCSSFTGELTLPESLTHMGDHAFYGCRGFSGKLTLPKSLTEIGDYAFDGCRGFTGELTLPESLTHMGDRAFNSCSGFSGELTLPEFLTQIGNYAFYGCSFTGYNTASQAVAGLLYNSGVTAELIKVGNNNPYVQPEEFEREGMTYRITGLNTVTLIRCKPPAASDSLTIPETVTAKNNVRYTVTAIGNSAFYGCSGFSGELTLPNTLTQIGYAAFNGCSGFTGELTLPNTLTQIGNSAFYGCSSLDFVHLGNGLLKLGRDAFPSDLPLYTDSPRVQLLINKYLDRDAIADTAWDGMENVPDGAIATVKQDVAVTGGKQIGREAEITVPDGVTLTVDGTLTVAGSLTVNGTLQINGTLSGSGTLYIGRGGKVVGDVSGVRVEYPEDMEDAKNLIENHSYQVAQAMAVDAAAVKTWLTEQIAARSGLSATGVTVGEITVTSFTPATAGKSGDPDGTDGSFAFTAPLSKGSGTGQATGSGSITATAYRPTGRGGGSSYNKSQPQSSYTVAGDKINQTIIRSDLKKLADTDKSLTLVCDKASMTFAPAALNAILAAVPTTAGTITFAAAPADLSAFPDAAKQIGAHPVYDFTIRYKDSEENKADVNFPAGSASISLTYPPAAGEVAGNLFMVYVDGKGAVTWLDQSSYDNGKVLAEAPHFSTYGVAYQVPAPTFTDIEGNWAKDDILFLAGQGLLNGTGGQVFSPNGSMTRGMFITALWRLAGNPQAAGEGGAFTDVPSHAYYADAVRWAAAKGIVSGVSATTFAPEQAVTRQEMAAIVQNYAGAMGYELPVTREAVTFADAAAIASWAKDAVRAMQQAGILMGRDANRFDPAGTATRGEVAALLHRYMELVIPQE